MVLNTVKITGTFNFPDASWTQFARARFIISGFDTNGAIATPHPVVSDLSASGNLDVDLWPNAGGLRGTVYRVLVDIYTDNSYSNLIRSVDFGKIQVSGAADISDLLNAPVTVSGVWYTFLSEAEYAAAIAAKGGAEAAATAAQTAIGAASINAQVGDYTLVAGDAGSLVTVGAAGAKTITIPADATAGWATNVVISVMRLGAGEVNIRAAAGVYLNGVTAGSTAISETYGLAQLIRLGADAWAIAGLTDGVTA